MLVGLNIENIQQYCSETELQPNILDLLQILGQLVRMQIYQSRIAMQQNQIPGNTVVPA